MTRKIMKSRMAQQAIKDIAGDNKTKQKETQDLFAAGADFAIRYYEMGKQHKVQEMHKQNIEQFMYFNDLHKLDFAKDGVSKHKSEEMTKAFVSMVVYPAYEAGYDGLPL